MRLFLPLNAVNAAIFRLNAANAALFPFERRQKQFFSGSSPLTQIFLQVDVVDAPVFPVKGR